MTDIICGLIYALFIGWVVLMLRLSFLSDAVWEDERLGHKRRLLGGFKK